MDQSSVDERWKGRFSIESSEVIICRLSLHIQHLKHIKTKKLIMKKKKISGYLTWAYSVPKEYNY